MLKSGAPEFDAYGFIDTKSKNDLNSMFRLGLISGDHEVYAIAAAKAILAYCGDDATAIPAAGGSGSGI